MDTERASVKIKYGESIRKYDLQRLSRFVPFCMKLNPKLSEQNEDYDIILVNPQNEITSFIYESCSFKSELQGDGSCVILSQYGIPFQKIYPTSNDDYYLLEIKKSGNLILIKIWVLIII